MPDRHSPSGPSESPTKHEHLGSEYWVSSALCDMNELFDQKLNRLTMPRMLSYLFPGQLISPLLLILDVGPQPTIWFNIPTLALTGKRGKNQIVALLSAFSSLFEKGFLVEISELFSQMDHQFTFTQLPTYPFQRLYNYPAYIATRDSLLSVVHHQIEPAACQKSSDFVVDQVFLFDFLDLHRIEGCRVLPGAAMVDFFA